MNLERIKKYFKKNISYDLFLVSLLLFVLSVVVKLCSLFKYPIIPYWGELIPGIQIALAFLMVVLVITIIIIEDIIK